MICFCLFVVVLRWFRIVCILWWLGEVCFEGIELLDCELDCLLISGEVDYECCSGLGFLGCSCGEFWGFVKGLIGCWFFDEFILIFIFVLCCFFWKNWVREKFDLELFGLSGWNDVRFIFFLDILVWYWGLLVFWYCVCFFCCFFEYFN